MDERREQYSRARICVEVDLEVGIPEVIKLTVAYWSHVQELDSEQLPFKCRHCHGYGHFARSCKKKTEEEADKEKGELIQEDIGGHPPIPLGPPPFFLSFF